MGSVPRLFAGAVPVDEDAVPPLRLVPALRGAVLLVEPDPPGDEVAPAPIAEVPEPGV